MRKLIKFNEHGHLLISITSLGLTGSEEIERLEAGGCVLTEEAKCVLLNQTPLGYDTKHRLEKGAESKIVLIPNRMIPDIEPDQLIGNHRIEEYASSFNYRIPPAGIAPYLCTRGLYMELSLFDIPYILIFHEPIAGYEQFPHRLNTFNPYCISCLMDSFEFVCMGATFGLLKNNVATAFLAPD